MAEEIDIPLFNGVYKNIDETVSNDKSFKLIDGILDKELNIFSRPGLALLKASASGRAFDGLYWCDSLSKLFGLSNGNLYVYDSSYTETNLSSGGVSINTSVRPTFAFDGTRVLVANGSQIMYTDGTSVTAFIADGDAPTTVTHILILDTYLIANDVDSETWYFSEVADTLTWSALDFATAGSEPDYINAAIKFRGEIYFFGRETLEIWENDGQTPFIRVNGGSFDTGCVAPYSVIKLKNAVMWLSPEKQFVKFSGSGIEVLSTQYDKEIFAMSVVTDCTADKYVTSGKVLIAFQFPSEGRTIVYNETDDNWCEFGYWNAGSGAHEAFLGACSVYIPEDGTMLIGSRKQDGKLYEMSDESFTDDSNPIKLLSRSGHINYGTNNLKRNVSISFRVKRGYITDATTPVATLRLRDNNGEWGQEIQFSLGAMGEYFNTIKKHKLGTYRSRQYEFSCTDAVGFILSEAKEEIEVTDR
jgi:hypothetical protein